MPLKFCAAILAVRQRWACVFRSAEPALARSSFECANRGVTENNFCRFIGHLVEEITKTRWKRLLCKAFFLDGVEMAHLQESNENIYYDTCQFVGDFHT